MSAAERFARLPTAPKLLLILTAVLLPIGIALTFFGQNEINNANAALQGRSADQAQATAQSIESLIARNALALRIAANGALAGGRSGACDRARKSLAIAPAVAQHFELETPDGEPVCATSDIGDTGSLPDVAPGDIRLRIAPNGDAITVRTGVIGGMATALIPLSELRGAMSEAGPSIDYVVLDDGKRELRLRTVLNGATACFRSPSFRSGTALSKC